MLCISGGNTICPECAAKDCPTHWYHCQKWLILLIIFGLFLVKIFKNA